MLKILKYGRIYPHAILRIIQPSIRSGNHIRDEAIFNLPIQRVPSPREATPHISNWHFVSSDTDSSASVDKVQRRKQLFVDKKCESCGLALLLSPELRRGPSGRPCEIDRRFEPTHVSDLGKNSLCNRCGIRFAREKRKVLESMSIQSLLCESDQDAIESGSEPLLQKHQKR